MPFKVVETLLDNGVSKSFIFTERTSDIVSSTLGHANAVQMRPGLGKLRVHVSVVQNSLIRSNC